MKIKFFPVLLLFMIILSCSNNESSQIDNTQKETTKIEIPTPTATLTPVETKIPIETKVNENSVQEVATLTPKVSTEESQIKEEPVKTNVEGNLSVEIDPNSIARYIVYEQLVRWASPRDVVGETKVTEGKLVFGKDGEIIPEESIIIVDLKNLKSDSDKRDDYIKRNALESNKYPEGIFIPDTIQGLQWPFPTEGDHTFTMLGDMTVHGITKPVEWTVEANVVNKEVKGKASTKFDFSYFDINKPDLRFILILDDELRIELDFTASVNS